jgi:pimeloyl-ACP methyl ester carboxylesterase
MDVAITRWLKRRAWHLVCAVAVTVTLATIKTPNADTIGGDKIGIVLMHGKGGTTNAVLSLSQALKGAGVLVKTPLMPWSKDRIYDKGYDESMIEIDGHVAKLREAGAKKIIVAGHSIGANAALGYAARREGLSGVILLAFGHVPGSTYMAERLEESTEQAQTMIQAGNAEDTRMFRDHNAGKSISARGSAIDIFSWFNPRGPATIRFNAPKVKLNTPVLCIDGSSDPNPRCRGIMDSLHNNPLNLETKVSASHVGTPSSSIKDVVNWLQVLAGEGTMVMNSEEARAALDDWLVSNKQLCSKDADYFSESVHSHIAELVTNKLVIKDFTVSKFKMKRLYAGNCS